MSMNMTVLQQQMYAMEQMRIQQESMLKNQYGFGNAQQLSQAAQYKPSEPELNTVLLLEDV